MDESAWASLKAQARGILWDRGKTGQLIQYGELATTLGMHLRSGAFFELLDALCVEEAEVADATAAAPRPAGRA